MTPFAPGRTVLYRHIARDRVVGVRPCRVISDDDRGLLLWLPRGSAVAVELAADGRGVRDMPFTEWVTGERRLHEATWQGPAIVKFLPRDAHHSVWFLRDDRDAFVAWYVNLEEPLARWDDGPAAGVDVIDQDLDIVAAPDRSWRWKDEDEFAERLALPEQYWVPDEAAVWAEGYRAIELIEAGKFPFDGTWTDFEPDPSWLVPQALPPGWDRPAAAERSS
ncbi:DUF402 domain-containing protein [Krasilnikovia sp. MM14-A1004]|uniref:DUF402 domain-containing protein n=1 Tax=Krasilnikovia sp. MM14-A1004 TaxID=3373541 RepID=UPI00399CCA11